MAKVPRKNFRQFGSTFSTDEMGVFGSLAAGSAATTTNVETMQSLSQWLDGWYSAIVGLANPALEDWNAFCFVIAYMIFYNFEMGVSEWDSATTYYTGSLINNGSGRIYRSLQDTNLNHAITDTAWWSPVGGRFIVTNSNNAADVDYDVIICNPSGNYTQTLAAASAWAGQTKRVVVKGTGTNIVTLALASGNISGNASIPLNQVTNDAVELFSDGTDAYIM